MLLSPSKAPVAPLAPDGKRLRTLELSACSLQYRLKRSSRKPIGFLNDATGLTITALRWATIADIENAITKKQKWIFSKLIEWQTRAEWRDEAELPYLGKPMSVRLGAVSLAFNEASECFRYPCCGMDVQQIKDRVTAWLQGRGDAEL